MNTINQRPTRSASLPRELRTVLKIFNYDMELRTKALPDVNVERQRIDWPRIWANDFSGGHAASILWAQAIWCDRVETKGDPFDRAFSMDLGLQRAFIEALAIRWGYYETPNSAPPDSGYSQNLANTI